MFLFFSHDLHTGSLDNIRFDTFGISKRRNNTIILIFYQLLSFRTIIYVPLHRFRTVSYSIADFVRNKRI